MIVGAADEADLPPVGEIEVGEPLEGAVHRVHLDQPLELRVAARPVAGGVRVRDHQDVLGRRLGMKAAIELGQRRRHGERNQIGVGVAEDHVVMTAGRALRRPLVGEERDHATVGVGGGRQAPQRPPLGGVEPGCRARSAP